MINNYPRESVEFQPILITLDGTPFTTAADIEVSITAQNARPSTWIASTSLNGEIGVMIQNLAVGTYLVWARITDSPEIPVINCGAFAVS
jgi:hypothetical protein